MGRHCVVVWAPHLKSPPRPHIERGTERRANCYSRIDAMGWKVPTDYYGWFLSNQGKVQETIVGDGIIRLKRKTHTRLGHLRPWS
jgi:hypothetical protein